jgi:hypothetical protein
MSADIKYSRIAFPHADACGFGPVTIYAGDWVTKIGQLPVAKLRNRPDPVPAQHAVELAPRDAERPTVAQSPDAWRRAKRARRKKGRG